MKRRFAMGLSILLGCIMLQACMFRYLVRQGVAQLRVLSHREPLEEVLPEFSEAMRQRIGLVQAAKKFARERLELPVDDVYETYSGVHPDPIWNISACAKDQLEPYEWKYPVLGRLPYIGFYDRDDANTEKQRLLELDLDVMMYGAGAFSSLGWFSDPIVPSMLKYRDLSLVNTVIHESAHRYLFFKLSVDFNESFASFVGDYGAIQFYSERDGEASELAVQARGERQDAQVMERFVRELIDDLEAIYSRDDLSRVEKLEAREAKFEEAKDRYGHLNLATNAYDSFKTRDLNNAVLLAMRRYGRQSLFDRLYQACGGDIPAAMRVAASLDPRKLSRKERSRSPFERLEEYLERGGDCLP